MHLIIGTQLKVIGPNNYNVVNAVYKKCIKEYYQVVRQHPNVSVLTTYYCIPQVMIV